MAEFQDVMKRAKRMCGAHSECDNCSMRDVIGNIGCPFLEAYIDRAGQIEHIVMEWAASHPEPRYPSWQDAWNKLFPEAAGGVPCPKYFISEKQYDEMCIGNDCECCLESPIPADIAEKLGIKPIGGTTDENA